jgi:hypothetical protein
MATDALSTYLNDHLAGATAALQLLDHLMEHAEHAGEERFFRGLRDEIAEDRAELERLLHRLGGEASGLRAAGGWLAERIGRIKLAFDDPARGTLQRLEALETLALGIQGKQALWTALGTTGSGVPALASVDLARLARRAGDQHARVEARRLASARRLLEENAVGERSAPPIGQRP